MSQQKLLTKADVAKLPPLCSQDGKGDDAVVYVKFFCIVNNMRWWATEYDSDQGLFFGYVTGGDFDELGYFSLAEMEGCKRGNLPLIERDAHFKPMTLGEVKLLFGRDAA